MILLEDDLPAPMSFGQVSFNRLLAQQENLFAPDYQMGLSVSPAEWVENCILLRLIGVLVSNS